MFCSKDHWGKGIILAVLFCGLGFSTSLIGPSLVQLSLVLGEPMHKLAWVVTCIEAGQLLGAILTFAFFDKFNKEAMLAFAAFVCGAALVVAPFSGHLYVLFTFCCLSAAGHGFLSNGGTAYVLSTWTDTNFQKKGRFCLLAMQGFGGALGLICTHAFFVNDGGFSFVNATNTSTSKDTDEDTFARAFAIRYSYITVGCVLCLFCLIALFTARLTIDNWLNQVIRLRKTSWVELNHISVAWKYVILLAPLCFTISSIVGMFIYFLPTFIVTNFMISPQQTSFLIAAMFAAHCVATACSVPLADSDRIVIPCVLSLLLIIASTILIFFINLHNLEWAVMITSGAALSLIQTSSANFIDRKLELSKRDLQILTALKHISGLVYPPVIGYLFYSHPSVIPFVFLGLAIVYAAYLIVLLCCNNSDATNIANDFRTSRDSLESITNI